MKASLVFYLVLSTGVIFLNGCREKNTENPNEVYTFWSGEDHPPSGVHLIHGKYWKSSHWSNEYIVYLELRAPQQWMNEFIKQNNLDYKTDTLIPPEQDAPKWFTPSKDFKIYLPSGFSEGSVYYEDSVRGKMFIYEIHV